MANKLGEISVHEVLKKDGFNLVGENEDGTLSVRDNSNYEEYVIDDPKTYVMNYLQETEPGIAKLGANAFNITINDKENPMETSNVDIMERGAMGFGNIKGGLEFLKGKYDNVTVNSQGRIVYQDGNKWHSVDPSGLGDGDAFDIASELGNDIADLVGEAFPVAGGILGEMKGAAIGSALGPGGALAGGLAGAGLGAGVGEGIRTSIGRIVGTYDETPTGQLADAGMEALFALGGYGMGAAAGKIGKKAFNFTTKNPETMGMLGAMKGIKNAPREVKDGLAGFLQFTTGKSPVSAQRVINNPEGVLGTLNSLTKNPANYDDIVTSARKQSVDDLQSFLSDSMEGFNNSFAKLEKEVIATTPGPVDMQSTVKEMVSGIQDDSFLGQFLGRSEDGKLIVKAMKDINLAKDVETMAAINSVHSPLKKFVNQLNILEGQKTVSSQTALAARRQIDSIVYGNKSARGLPDNVKGFFTEHTSKLRNELADHFDKGPAGAKYREMNDMYMDNMTVLSEARKVIGSKDPAKMETFLSKIVKGSAEGSRIKINSLSKYAPMSAKQTFDSILDREAALEFMQVFPHFRNIQAGPAVVIGVAGGLAASDTVDPTVAGLGAAALLSPRMAAKAIGGLVKSGAKMKRMGGAVSPAVVNQAQNVNEVIKRLTPVQKKQLLNNPKTLMRLMGTVTQMQNE